MNLRKRCVAFGDLSRAATVLMLLLVAPLGLAQGRAGGVLMFDVPEQSQEQGPVTVNLLTSDVLGGPANIISDAQILVTLKDQRSDRPLTTVVGQYCVMIAPSKLNIATEPDQEGRRDEVSLQVTVGDSPLPLIGVFDTDRSGGTVNPEDPSCFAESEIPNKPPSAVLKAPTTVADTDRRNGEMVTLDASGSMDPDGKIVNYKFTDSFNDVLASGTSPIVTVFLPDGENRVSVTVTDNSNPTPVLTATKTKAAISSSAPSVRTVSFNRSSGRSASNSDDYEGGGATASASATIIVNPLVPVADPGKYAPFPDTDFLPGEVVTLDGSGSIVPQDEGVRVSFAWFRLGNDSRQPLGTGSTIKPKLPDGDNIVQLELTIARGESNESFTVTGSTVVTIAPPRPKNQPPVARFTVSRAVNGIVNDSDFAPGEKVVLDASASTDDGQIVNYEFRDQNEQLLAPAGSNPIVPVSLSDGETTITLTVTDDAIGPDGEPGLTNSTSLTVNVLAPEELVVSAGDDVNQKDTDFKEGEDVQLTASITSTVPPNIAISFQWFLFDDNDENSEDEGVLIGETNPLNYRFPDGQRRVRLIVSVGEDTDIDDVNVTVAAPRQRVVIVAEGGDNRTVPDSDGQPGEVVPLDASASTVPEQISVIYQWFLVSPDGDGESLQELQGSPGKMIMPPLADGTNHILLRLTVQKPGKEGYGGGSYGKGSYGKGSYGKGSYGEGSYGEGSYGGGGYGGGYNNDALEDRFTVTVQAPRPKVVIAIKPAATVPDSDALDGETVTLDGSASQVPTDRDVTFQWFTNPTAASNGTLLSPEKSVITARLNNGVTKVRLVITVDGVATLAEADVTVVPPQSVVADPGTYDPKGDTDGFPGEVVQLDASRSRVPDGVVPTFEWFRDPVGESNGVSLGTGPMIAPRLKDGTTIVRLVVTANGQRSIADVTLSVGSPGQAAKLAELPNLTPNQRRVAVALDDVCGRLIGLTSGLNGPATSQDVMPGTNLNFTGDQADLANKCRGIAINNTVDNQVEAVSDLTPDDFAVARTQALLFANTQYASVLDRLIALRGGARGLSLAGLNIQVDGNTVPLAVLQEMFGKILGGGASADATEEPGGLLSDRWGMWMRGNVSTGDRDKSLVSPSFDVDQTGIVLGTDFRLTNNAVVGASIAYLDSQIEFNPLNEGGLDTKSMALSLYGSVYAAKSFYLDALANIAKADYEAKRNISFSQGSNLGDLDLDAKGDTDGITLSAGLSGGYDFLLFKRVTFAPNAGFFYIDATIDGFTESGASGFNLLYDEQNFKSFTGNLGFRVNSTLNLPWVVLLPGLRVDYIREFNDDVDVFQVRFAADPNGNAAPPINIQTDNPDSSYWRLSLNVSAQFKFGFAGYIEYQRIDSYADIAFQDLAFGLRMQRSF